VSAANARENRAAPEIPMPDCKPCGACCLRVYDALDLTPREAFHEHHPELVTTDYGRLQLQRAGQACPMLLGDGERTPYRCADHEHRPQTCRDFEQGGSNCHTTRRLAAHPPQQEAMS